MINQFSISPVLDRIQSILYFPITLASNVKNYILNRYKYPSHALVSNLKRGVWHDLDEKILHSLFDELINFVEIELAFFMVIIEDDGQKKYNIPKKRLSLIGNNRYPKAGYDYLELASKYVFDKDTPGYTTNNKGKPIEQAIVAQEVKVLYNWWKYERPKRVDPDHELISDSFNLEDEIASLSSNMSPSQPQKIQKAIEIEQQYYEEDTEMLIRLIKIRNGLWT